MNLWIINNIAVLLLCIFCAGIVIPQILLIAFRKKLMDVPDERKIHHSLVPRLGGIAFKPVILFSLAFVVGINLLLGNSQILDNVVSEARPLLFGFCALLVLYLVGMADDLIGVRYRAKFVIQIICALMLCAGGVFFSDLFGLLGIHQIPVWIGIPLTILVVVFITNAINLIDGIDGLASSLSGIACLFYGFVFFKFGHYFYAMLSYATFGVLLPFFWYNVFGNAEKQKKIFMGDTGSLSIGIILSFLSIKLLSCVPSGEASFSNPLIIAFVPLAVPGLDVIRVYFHRIRNKTNPFLPDKNHIHHKLLALGLNQRVAMISIVAFSILLILSNILLSHYLDVNIVILLDIIVWTLLNIWLSSRISSLQKSDKPVVPKAANAAISDNGKRTTENGKRKTDNPETAFQIDATKILNYLSAHGGQCTVDDLKLHSGAEPLRIHPIIYRLALANKLQITAFDSWGAPLSVLSLKS